MATPSLAQTPAQLPEHLITEPQLILPFLLTNALHIVGAVVILVVGFWVSGKADLMVRGALGRSKRFDEMLRGFFGSIARYFVLVVTMLAVLSQFGIQTTSLVAVVGAASLAIGLALQGTLSNLAAGVMLLIFRPFRVGHHIQVGGADGIVRELSLFWTEVITTANVQVIIPNGGVWGQTLRNFSVYDAPVPTSQLIFPASAIADPVTAQTRIAAIVEAHPQILKTPAPTVFFDRGGADNALQIVVTFAPSGDVAAVVKNDIIKSVHEALEMQPDRQMQSA